MSNFACIRHDKIGPLSLTQKRYMIPVKWATPTAEAILYRRYIPKRNAWSYGIVMYMIQSLGQVEAER